MRDGDEWVVNGQKVWTSGAQYSDFGEIVCRTNPEAEKHKGITAFIVNMRAPGVTIKPIKQMNGGSGFNEVFFDDVRVPADHVLGGVHEGWTVAITTLMNERVAIGSGGGGGGRGNVHDLIDLARSRGLNNDPLVRQRLATSTRRAASQKFASMRTLTAARAGQGARARKARSASSSAGRCITEIGELAIDLVGAGAVARADDELPLAHAAARRTRRAHRGRVRRGDEEHHRRACARTPRRTPGRQGRPLERRPALGPPTVMLDVVAITPTISMLRFEVVECVCSSSRRGIRVIDTGPLGSEGAILRRARAVGRPGRCLRQIVLTHSHKDHAGSARALAEETGATVLAGARDAPVIAGTSDEPAPVITTEERPFYDRIAPMIPPEYARSRRSRPAAKATTWAGTVRPKSSKFPATLRGASPSIFPTSGSS